MDDSGEGIRSSTYSSRERKRVSLTLKRGKREGVRSRERGFLDKLRIPSVRKEVGCLYRGEALISEEERADYFWLE